VGLSELREHQRVLLCPAPRLDLVALIEDLGEQREVAILAGADDVVGYLLQEIPLIAAERADHGLDPGVLALLGVVADWVVDEERLDEVGNGGGHVSNLTSITPLLSETSLSGG